MKVVIETLDGHRFVYDATQVDENCPAFFCAIYHCRGGEFRRYDRTGYIATVTPIVGIDLPVYKETP